MSTFPDPGLPALTIHQPVSAPHPRQDTGIGAGDGPASDGTTSGPLTRQPQNAAAFRLALVPMQTAWLPAVMEVQARAYAGLPVLEPIEFFANRQQLAPEGCQIVLDRGEVAGYLVSYPWDDGLPPALGATLDALPPARRHWFIHDCAVNPCWQGRGVARQLLQAVERTAQRLRVRSLRLVSLAGANGYWQRQGFKPVQPACAAEARRLREKLSGYGEGACLMQRPVPEALSPTAMSKPG